MFLLKLAPKEDRPYLKQIARAFLFLILFAMLVLSFTGCERSAPKPPPTATEVFRVELLFETDGCKVYRFRDGYDQYFTTCEGSVTSAHNETCGKGCQRTKHTKVETKHKGNSCDAKGH